MKFWNWGLTTTWHNVEWWAACFMLLKITPPYCVLCSPHFFGKLRKSEVPEPTQAAIKLLNWVGFGTGTRKLLLRLQTLKLNVLVIFSAVNLNTIITVLFILFHWILYKVQSGHYLFRFEDGEGERAGEVWGRAGRGQRAGPRGLAGKAHLTQPGVIGAARRQHRLTQDAYR